MVFAGVLIILCFGVHASIPNLDYDTNVLISTGGTAFMEISSNPTTGYWWSIEQNHSEKLSVKDYFGEYTSAPSDIDGAQGKQMFEIHCDNTCVEGESFAIHLICKRSWESTFIDEKNVVVLVTNEPRIQ